MAAKAIKPFKPKAQPVREPAAKSGSRKTMAAPAVSAFTPRPQPANERTATGMSAPAPPLPKMTLSGRAGTLKKGKK